MFLANVESCKTAKCGSGKKCVQRNDQPKCICAPNCKASKGQRNNQNAKQNMRYIQKENELKNKRVVQGVEAMQKRRRNSKGLHVVHANKDVDFVDASANNSSKFGRSERVILTDSKVFNRIHGDNKKRTKLNKSIKNEYVKGNHTSMMSEGHQQTNWPKMIRTGGYGYDAPFPSNTFAVKFYQNTIP